MITSSALLALILPLQVFESEPVVGWLLGEPNLKLYKLDPDYRPPPYPLDLYMPGPPKEVLDEIDKVIRGISY